MGSETSPVESSRPGPWERYHDLLLPLPRGATEDEQIAIVSFLEALSARLSNLNFEFRFDDEGTCLFRDRDASLELGKIYPAPSGVYETVRDLLLELDLDPPPPSFQTPDLPFNSPPTSLETRREVTRVRLRDILKILTDHLGRRPLPPNLSREERRPTREVAATHVRLQYRQLAAWVEHQRKAGTIQPAILRKHGRGHEPERPPPFSQLIIPSEHEYILEVNGLPVQFRVTTGGKTALLRIPCRVPGANIQIEISGPSTFVPGEALLPSLRGLLVRLHEEGLTILKRPDTRHFTLSAPKPPPREWRVQWEHIDPTDSSQNQG